MIDEASYYQAKSDRELLDLAGDFRFNEAILCRIEEELDARGDKVDREVAAGFRAVLDRYESFRDWRRAGLPTRLDEALRVVQIAAYRGPSSTRRDLIAELHELLEFARAMQPALELDPPDEWFRWPSTELRPAGQHNRSAAHEHPDEGMLKRKGYHVGHTKPVGEGLRRRYLDELFVELLYHEESEYLTKWGDPASPHRLLKLANVLASLARSRKRRGEGLVGYGIHGKAIDEWESDLVYLYDRYYVGQFGYEKWTSAP